MTNSSINNLLNEIEKERKLLHEFVNNNCSKEKILKQSQKLDKLLNKFMENLNNQ